MSAPTLQPDPVDEAAAQPGRDSVELQLCAIWRKLLDRQDVGVHDDFFELGGHSLLAIKHVVEIRKHFKIDITVSDLIGTRTIAELAPIVRQGGSREQGPLVRLQVGTSGVPVYAFPPVSGTVLVYPQVARAVGTAHTFWALQSSGLNPGEEPLGSIEEIAAHFIRAMRTVHPDGTPWHLLGYSMGGLIAFEVARQLRAAGERVGLVGLLDTRTTVEPSDDPDFALRALLFRGLRLELDVDWLRSLTPEERSAVLLEKAHAAGTVPADFDAERLRRMIDMYQHNLDALAGYEVGPFDGRLVLYRVTDRAMEPENYPEDLGWTEFAAEVTVTAVPGDHFTMIEPGNVEALAAAIRADLTDLAELTELT
ncbi:thioesterase domain-containing protein [Streptacidiphilus jiangxiensis]|uniref:Thioesterase domain-containing protein n=1 Tax=Streptacidiphilus jiangxiensis TaxID=235985 RepID=A0A1H7Y3Q8_STRJI|nr:thioesterase domain-containing protein [Streptacidiphilus jiangxiensis]SEM40623.1 Thioesterase domain-containing protein [Streptacidiphilus jiangxiensis]